MKFTLSWLKEHLDTDATVAAISEKLTAIGLEVESVSDATESLNDFTVAKITDAKPHPDADKLQVCTVESDTGNLQIVCGAANARAGLYVALAKEGVYIPGSNFTIRKTSIRGVESNGMLCSSDELGIEGDGSGIIELPAAEIGSSVAAALGMDDPVFDIAITPNRADCLGVYGIARDLAATGLGKLKTLSIPSPSLGGDSPITVEITSKHCQQFIGCYLKDVENKESPDWLKKRLTAIGLRPISALVDITNYFSYDLGRPLHVYDADKLNGSLTVRDSKAGEKIKALDEKEYDLEFGMCVIADEKAPVAIGGVMGGEASGCSETTKNVFLEVALFNPSHVANTGRKLQIESDARYRFERGVDVAFLEDAARLAIVTIMKICGGEPSKLVTAGHTPEWKRDITLPENFIQTLGGIEIEQSKVKSILTALGFKAHGTEYTVPSWRADVEGAADLAEEILRIHGYDNIPEVPMPKPAHISERALTRDQKREHIAKRLLTTRGYLEVVSWSFLSAEQFKRFGGMNDSLELLNPISEDLSHMRPSLLANLLEAAESNHNRGYKNLRLAEVGLSFSDITPKGQNLMAGGLITGDMTSHTMDGVLFKTSASPASALAAKADAMAVLTALGVTKFDITTNTPAWYHPGRSGALTLGGKIILGYFGEIHPAILSALDIETPCAGFEIFLHAVPAPRAKGKSKPKLVASDYQAVARDFAFVVNTDITAAAISKAIASAEKKLITDIGIFDVYAGKGVDDGKKSVAVQVTLQASDRTLSDEEISGVTQAIIASVEKATGGRLRA